MTLEPADALPVGHYAIGVLPDGELVDVYCASPSLLLNVATGLPVVSLLGWRRQKEPYGPQEPTEGSF